MDDARVIEAPAHLTSVEVASLPTAGVTAWSAIREGLDASFSGELGDWRDGKRLQGKTVLTQGTGGVSCFAIQAGPLHGHLCNTDDSSRSQPHSAQQ